MLATNINDDLLAVYKELRVNDPSIRYPVVVRRHMRDTKTKIVK